MEREFEWELTVNGALAALSETLLSPQLSLEDISCLVLEETVRLTGNENGFAGIIDKSKGYLIFHRKSQMAETDRKARIDCHSMVFPTDADGHPSALWEHALNTGEGFYTDFPFSHPASQSTPDGHFPINNFLVVPAKVDDELLGLIVLSGGIRDFSDRDLVVVKRCAAIYALALHRYYLEEELRTSVERYRMLLDEMVDGLYVIDNNAELTYVNDSFCSMLGYTTEEVLGRKVSDLFNVENLAIYEQMIRHRQLKDYIDELEITAKDGRQIPTSMSFRNLFDDKGDFLESFAMIRDITPPVEKELLLRNGIRDQDQRVKELNCLYSISRLADSPDNSLEDILQGTVEVLSSTWTHSDRACARIVVEDQEYTSCGFEVSRWGLSAPIRIQGRQIGSIEMHYRKERHFVKEEQDLIGAIAENISTIIARLKAERELQETLDHLEIKVAERTVGLTAINFQLKKYQKQLQSLASELSLTEERKRRSIATEIHDLIAQPLAFAKIKLESFKAGSSSAFVNEYSEVLEHIDQALKDTRNMIYEISPPTVYEFGLSIALKSLCETFQESHGLAIVYNDAMGEESIDDDVAIFLYKAARELLANIIKHAKADNAWVSLGTDEGLITLTVRDDGAGCEDMNSRVRFEAEGGFGLFSIRERLRVQGGKMIIQSEQKKGTLITLILPLNAES